MIASINNYVYFTEAVVYRNSTATSKYLTRSKRPTMIALTMMEQSVIIPMLDNLPMMLKSGMYSHY